MKTYDRFHLTSTQMEALAISTLTGNTDARNALIEGSAWMVRNQAAKYAKAFGVEEEDLCSEGIIALIETVDGFNPSTKSSFQTIAINRIKRAMEEYIGSLFPCRLPYTAFTKCLEQKKVCEDSLDDIVSDFVYKARERDAKDWTYYYVSFPEEEAWANILSEAMAELFSTLKDREVEIIRQRFGFADGQLHTLEDVGHQLHLSRDRIRMIQNKAITKLRHPSRAKLVRDFYY